MANTRAWLLGPPDDSDTASTPQQPIYQIVGRRSGEGADSVLEQLRNDPSRKAPEPPVEEHPE